MEHSQEHNESRRLELLESMGIMDSAPELCFNQLAYLASRVTDAPIALISFINSHRQWFKAVHGLEIQEIPKYVTACNQTLVENDRFEITDAHDERNPYREFMRSQGHRYYAGVPITSEDNLSMGALCVIDYVPRQLTEDQFKSLKVIANQITELLEIRKKYKENISRLKEIGEATYNNDKHYQEVAHKASLHAMAELSAGLSYRIKPLVMSVLGIAEKISEPSDSRMILKNSSHEILHVFDSLDKFISAESEKSMKLFEVRVALESIIAHLSYRLTALKVNFKLHVSEPEIICIGNESQLKEVFYAVLFNALDAVENMAERMINVYLKEENHKVIISVEDSGQGVSETVEPFIFQPFFTTKGSNSLGIGLSLAQSLMQRHSGEIILEKRYGPTRFSIILPKP